MDCVHKIINAPVSQVRGGSLCTWQDRLYTVLGKAPYGAEVVHGFESESMFLGANAIVRTSMKNIREARA